MLIIEGAGRRGDGRQSCRTLEWQRTLANSTGCSLALPGLGLDTFYENEGLWSFFTVTSLSLDRQGVKYISTLEAKQVLACCFPRLSSSCVCSVIQACACSSSCLAVPGRPQHMCVELPSWTAIV